MLHTDEILHVDITYNTAALYRYFITLQRELLEDTPATYIEEFKRKYEYFEGNSIRDLKTFLDSKGIKSQPRTDVMFILILHINNYAYCGTVTGSRTRARINYILNKRW